MPTWDVRHYMTRQPQRSGNCSCATTEGLAALLEGRTVICEVHSTDEELADAERRHRARAMSEAVSAPTADLLPTPAPDDDPEPFVEALRRATTRGNGLGIGATAAEIATALNMTATEGNPSV